MGVLRFLLAMAVVCAHTPFGTQFTGGRVAVQTFFMVSGFYISLILHTTYNDKALFWSNRILRLMPSYYVVALLTLVSVLVFDVAVYSRFEDFAQLPDAAKLFLVLTNALLFFQDITMFLGVSNGNLHFVTNFANSTPPLYHYLLVPQAWSLGIELSFYLIAPFALRLSDRKLYFLLAASFAVRAALYVYGLRLDPWNYRFFPSELAFFIIGALSQRYYEKYRHWLRKANLRLGPVVVVGVWAFTASFAHIPVSKTLLMVVYFAIVAMALPLLFETTRKSRIDRHIGELSYPIYLSHMLVISCLQSLWKGPLNNAFGFSACIITIGLSLLIYFLVDKPVGLIRERRKYSALSKRNRTEQIISTNTETTYSPKQ